jgi:hypothetical protein
MDFIAVFSPYLFSGSYTEPDASANKSYPTGIKKQVNRNSQPSVDELLVECRQEAQAEQHYHVTIYRAFTWQVFYIQQFHQPLVRTHLRFVQRIRLTKHDTEYAQYQYDTIVVWSTTSALILDLGQ